eukprot:TRINITY_DN14327_c0_g1_i10.p4 TRINITY_DN14327_c0_g1~~TRINITY_DN14327_c0_g1_i10.p4  ORF type:complete len:102 (-),score=14.13 TRINITY_DN14327_c0_g1_i10:305-610(-)
MVLTVGLLTFRAICPMAFHVLMWDHRLFADRVDDVRPTLQHGDLHAGKFALRIANIAMPKPSGTVGYDVHCLALPFEKAGHEDGHNSLLPHRHDPHHYARM